MKTVSRVHANNLVRWAKDRPEVLVFSADLTSSTEIDLFRAAYPKRFFSFGVAEQNMMSFAGGMAREGFSPFVHTFGVFMYRRAYDQIAMSIAYPRLRVRMFGFLPGVTTPGGASHQSIEDISVMRSLPGMTVLECGDATDVESVLDAAHAVEGPVYIRMLRGDIPRLFPSRRPLRVGKARVLSRGRDITVLSSGICTEEALRAVHLLKGKGVAVCHLHVSTLKPFNDPLVLQALANSRHGVITMENHSVIGGLGSCAAEKIAEGGMPERLVRIGLPDTFAHGAGRRFLMREFGLDASSLIRETEKLLRMKFKITPEDIRNVSLTGIQRGGNAEDL